MSRSPALDMLRCERILVRIVDIEVIIDAIREM